MVAKGVSPCLGGRRHRGGRREHGGLRFGVRDRSGEEGEDGGGEGRRGGEGGGERGGEGGGGGGYRFRTRVRRGGT